jgi:hypothetical protein
MSIYEQEIPDTFCVKDGEQLTYSEGWSDWLATELVDKTQQQHIKTWIDTSQDPIHFRSSERANRWYEKDAGKPLIIALGNTSLELAGIAWITNMGIVNKRIGHIFGVRVYDGYLEQGVATYLGKRIHRLYDEDRKKLLRYNIHVANQPAFALGIKLGYRMEESRRDREIDMVRRRSALL